MKIRALLKFKISMGVSLLLLLASFVLATGYFAVNLKNESEQALVTHLKTWQTEIAAEMYSQQKSPLLEKILNYHQDSHKVLRTIFVNQKKQCDYSFLHFVVNEVGPVGSVQTCYSYRTLALGAAQSLGVVFVVLLTAIILLMGFAYRQRQKYQQQILTSKWQHQKELADFARQTCHDMRSPIMTLQSLVKLSHMTDGKEHQLLKMATQRLQTMTQILSRRADIKSDISDLSENVSLENILMDFQIRSPEILWMVSSSGAGEFLISEDWARVITNILKNACEALQGKDSGRVSISWKARENCWVLQIADNGPGIPTAILSRLGQEPVTEGKQLGNGWGLYGAFKTAQKYGGSLDILSSEGVGTTMTLKIPRGLSVEHLLASES